MKEVILLDTLQLYTIESKRKLYSVFNRLEPKRLLFLYPTFGNYIFISKSVKTLKKGWILAKSYIDFFQKNISCTKIQPPF